MLNIVLPYSVLLLVAVLLLLLAVIPGGPDQPAAQRPWRDGAPGLARAPLYWGRGPGGHPHWGGLPGPWNDHFAGLFGDVASRIRR